MKKFICLLFALLMATQLTACASEATKALQEAKRAFNNAEWAEAKDYAQQVINNYPDTKAAQKAQKIVDDASEKMDLEFAETLVKEAEEAFASKNWQVVIDNYKTIVKLIPDSELADRVSSWNTEAESNWKKELTKKMKTAYSDSEWSSADSYASKIIQYFPDSSEASTARKTRQDAAAKIKAARESAIKAAAQSKLRISKCWVSGPDSAGGYELHINYTNKSDKAIKYFDFGVTFYNAVGDPISTWRIDKIEYCRDTGPIAPGGGQSDSSVYWGKYYDAPIDHPEIVSVDVEYMDGTTWTLTKDEIAYVQY